jgi:hypothetical protein
VSDQANLQLVLRHRFPLRDNAVVDELKRLIVRYRVVMIGSIRQELLSRIISTEPGVRFGNSSGTYRFRSLLGRRQRQAKASRSIRAVLLNVRIALGRTAVAEMVTLSLASLQAVTEAAVLALPQ